MKKKCDAVTEEDIRILESKLLAAAVAKENAMHLASNEKIKAEEKKRDQTRIENEMKLHELEEQNEKLRERENLNKKATYRSFLLQQIEDKEKLKQSAESNLEKAPTFTEELVDPTIKHNLKLKKQKEVKSSLDECIRLKNDMKLKIQLQDLEEDEKRSNFMKRREQESSEYYNKVKEKSETIEKLKQNAATMWMTQNCKSEERKKFMENVHPADTALVVGDKNEDLFELIEARKRLKAKEDLLQQIHQRMETCLQRRNNEKLEQERFNNEMEREKETAKRLKEEETKRKIEYSRNLQNLIQEKAEKRKHEMSISLEEDRRIEEKLREEEKRIKEEKVRLLEVNLPKLKEYLPPNITNEECFDESSN